MSEPSKDGGAAFPQFDVVAGERDGHGDAIDAYTTASGGLTKRDYFAAAALPAVIEGCAADKLLSGETRVQMFARKAFECADAMIVAREVKHG